MKLINVVIRRAFGRRELIQFRDSAPQGKTDRVKDRAFADAIRR
jgi:hypothetical protein